MRIIKAVFSHMFVVGLLIIAQILFLVVAIEKLNEYYAALNILLGILAALIALKVMNVDMNPDFKLPWLVLILTIPLIGVVVYFLFSKNVLTKKQVTKLNSIREKNKPYITISDEEDKENIKNLGELYGQNKYLDNVSFSKGFYNTKTTYFKIGEEFFDDLVAELKKAKKTIFMEYFIIEEGKMFNTIIDILAEKAKSGVDVRLIYDDLGSASKVKTGYYKKLQKLGIKCKPFGPFIPIISGIHNNRDHRKITVIDSVIGYMGGINLADEYINETHPFGVWKDSAIKLEGQGVTNLTLLFLNAYNYTVENNDDYSKYLDIDFEKFEGQGFVHPFGDGPKPADNEPIGESVYMNIINNAKKYVYITTPYLIIDFNLITALRNAALRDVDVRIITPHVPDKKIILNITRSYYKDLLNAGVKIYEFEPGFIHAKNFVCDDNIGVVGTINLDYRSLVHHYECGVLLINSPSLLDMKDDYINTLNQCIEIPIGFKLKFFNRVLNYILKFFTPLL